MPTPTFAAKVLIAAGFILHTYEAALASAAFSLGFWIWTLLPYFAGSLLLWGWNKPRAALGSLCLPIVFDLANHYAVFIKPESSTAALGMLFVPLWNLVLFVPIGGILGWLADRRAKTLAAAEPPSGGDKSR